MEVAEYSAEVLGWQRRPGPVKVWRIVEGRKKTEDGKIPRFSIQEIPEDRYDDALHCMLKTFLRDEPMCRNVGIVNHPDAVEDFRKIWSFILRQGIAVGAFLVDENNPKPTLAGVNMTMVHSDAVEMGLKSAVQFTSKYTHKVFDAVYQIDDAKEMKKMYNVDRYISGLGLVVNRQFRDQGLAAEILLARKEMSAAYGFQATGTIFTAPAAQHVAAKVGFEPMIERDFASFKNEDGSECFPGIESKSMKLMGMRL